MTSELPRASLVIQPGEVHIWLARTDFQDASLLRFEAPLSAAERDRAARYRFDGDRRRFIAAHGLLRALLGAYLGCAPEAVSMGAGIHGKPYVHVDHTGSRPHFNASHSGGWFVTAMALQPVGIDVEVVAGGRAAEQMADLILSPAERAAVAQLPELHQDELMYSIWTRKEAVLKALGVGLRESMRAISVSIGPETPPRVTEFADGADDPAEWLLHDFVPEPGVVGALALRARAARVRSWLLMPDEAEVWPSRCMEG